MNRAKVLVIDDDPEMLDLTQYELQSRGYEVVTAKTGEEGLKLISEQGADVALTDLQLPDIHGMELVGMLKEVSPRTEIIMVTGYSSLNDAISAIKAGAFYFIEKPVEFEELSLLLEKAIERSSQAEEIKNLLGRLSERTSYYNLIGSSKAMQDIYEIIEGVAESDANIMIFGESGTGKELIANAIHYKSLRAKKPFVKINCSALPKELIESELFGHTKGAFTGAATEKTGLIGQAKGGSLLLDEIGEMPVELQPKLLRVLQERVYYRLGSEKALEADFRLISSTNRDPLVAIRDGHLREDLYYRINTIEIHVPPLRDRAEDIQHLAEYFLKIYAEKYHRQVHSISQHVYERMFDYSWPGNVRELQNVIERAVLLSKGEVIEENILPTAISVAAEAVQAPSTVPALAAAVKPNAGAAAAPGAQDLTLEQMAWLIVNRIPESKDGRQRTDTIKQFEGAIVNAALERTRGNKQAAANLLGLYRP
ncbi:MAG: sigma-54-dependent Fis family transcriptional regulator, partial [Blastocatellia bacterium]|nr:sigma-54-dependent Fis family transcriptional regulator [Blastocatellia bacterium]